MVTLRPYQEAFCNSVIEGFTKQTNGKGPFKRLLGVMATGAGKTICFSKLVKHFHPKKSLILCDREELIFSAREKLKDSVDIFADVEKGDLRASMDADCIIGSVQSMWRRLDNYPKDMFDLVVVDEAHLSLSETWQKTLNHFKDHANILGVTATPFRMDKKDLLKFYEDISYEIGLIELIKQGYLSKVKVQTVPLKIDISDVHQKNGDYDANELDEKLTPYFEEIVNSIKQYAKDRKILVFLPLIKTSEKFSEVCNKNAIHARHIDGQVFNRKDLLTEFKDKKFQVLSNSMLLTTGYDDPTIDCIINLRPTRSQGLYQQMIGRGTRIAEGKSDLLILDFLWQFEKYGIMRPAHLIAKTQEQADAMTAKFEKSESSKDIIEVDEELIAEKEKELLDRIKAKQNKQSQYYDVVEWSVTYHQSEMFDYEPMAKWEEEGVSPKQRATLIKFGVNPDSVKCKGQASIIIGTMIKRIDLGLATPRQIKLLNKYGIKNASKMKIKEASDLITDLLSKKNEFELANGN